MESSTAKPATPLRPHHQRNKSSRTGILRALVLSRSRSGSPEPTSLAAKDCTSRTQTVPLLPEHRSRAATTRALGERQSNVQSPPSSPSKSRTKSHAAPKASKDGTSTKVPLKTADSAVKPKRSKSSTSLSAIFGKMNRSSKDLSAYAGPQSNNKENSSPPSSLSESAETPIWAQFVSTTQKPGSRPSTRDSKSSNNILDEIARYTPQHYSPSKQRNFNGTLDNPSLRPTLGNRPQSAFVRGTGMMSAIGRRVSGGQSSIEARRSVESSGRLSKDGKRRVSGERPAYGRYHSDERKVSGSSIEKAPKEKLNIAKRGGRVMAAVAMFQDKSKNPAIKEEAKLNPKAIDAAFEAVLDSRNVPEPMRQKMRSLTLRVKVDFVKQDQSASKTVGNSPSGTLTAKASSPIEDKQTQTEAQPIPKDNSKATKPSRPRSRTFTFSKGDKRSGEASPKKQRARSKNRPTSIHISKESVSASGFDITTPTTPTGSLDRRSNASAIPAEYIAYLKTHQDPAKVQVSRLHKLRILLRNETVAWVDSFISLGGMSEIVGLLHRTKAVKWREEHEDQLLHESLLCLKGLCTTGRALAELDTVADGLFPALFGMLFDDEKKGPAEYTTRTIIVSVLFTFLTAERNSASSALERRARRILAYLGGPPEPEDARPVDFVLGMRTPRPYKLWCREITHVTREVFWIFLHHLNVVPLPKSTSAGKDGDTQAEVSEEERTKILAATYAQRHFPGSRPPVPAAPYVGGVEWDATTYLSAHLDLMNGLLTSIPSSFARNILRAELQASGFEKTMGSTLRTCKEKFYSGVHDGLRAWVAAAAEDRWETRFVREGPTQEEQAARARNASPNKSPKKEEAVPQLDAPKIDTPRLKLSLGVNVTKGMNHDNVGGNDDGWLG